MNYIKDTEIYRSADMALVALISLSVPIEAIDRQNPRKAVFMFRRSKELDELIESYFRQEITVEPQTFFAQLKVIKQRLYAEE